MFGAPSLWIFFSEIFSHFLAALVTPNSPLFFDTVRLPSHCGFSRLAGSGRACPQDSGASQVAPRPVTSLLWLPSSAAGQMSVCPAVVVVICAKLVQLEPPAHGGEQTLCSLDRRGRVPPPNRDGCQAGTQPSGPGSCSPGTGLSGLLQVLVLAGHSAQTF